MIVAGFGMRAASQAASFQTLLGDANVSHLAVLAAKRHVPGFCAFADAMGLPVIEIGDVAGVKTQAHSARIAERFGAGSVCEAVAIAAVLAAPLRARLAKGRVVSKDGMVTMAIAEGRA